VPEETTPREEASAQPATPASVVAAAAATLTFVRAPDFKVCFSDFHQIRAGNGVLTVVFSKTTHAPAGPMIANIIEEHVEVVMSWTQLKMVAQNLSASVSAIEAELGPIPFPRDFRINDAANRAIVRALGLSLSSETPPKAE